MKIDSHPARNFTVLSYDLLGQGKQFANGKPIGVTVRATFERSRAKAIRYMKESSQGTHVLIDARGRGFQLSAYHTSQRHGGKVRWGGHDINNKHLIVSLLSWGVVVPGFNRTFRSETGDRVSPANIFPRPANIAAKSGQFPIMYWDIVSAAQLETFESFIMWAVTAFNIDPAQICGFDEARGDGTRFDPGGVLPYSMEKLRAKIRVQLNKE